MGTERDVGFNYYHKFHGNSFWTFFMLIKQAKNFISWTTHFHCHCSFSKAAWMLLGGKDKSSSFWSVAFFISASWVSWNINSWSSWGCSSTSQYVHGITLSVLKCFQVYFRHTVVCVWLLRGFLTILHPGFLDPTDHSDQFLNMTLRQLRELWLSGAREETTLNHGAS